jgi:hypothetical protein
MMESKIHSGSKYSRFFFFVAGIVATIAYRITPFLQPLEVKIAWYIGTVGFIVYFWHRSGVETKRAELVKHYNLVEAVDKSDLQGDEKTALAYLVKTSLTSRARYDSAFIVLASLLALIGAIVVDLHIIK